MEKRQLTILVVDDEPAHVEAIVRAFAASDPEVTVQVSGSLAEFRRLTTVVPSDLPHLAIMDLNLPDGRAVEVLTAPPEDAPFPVLVMTSYGNEETAVEAMKAGALDYVLKSPDAFASMPRKVRRALREWALLQERRQARAMIEGLAHGWQQTFDAIPYPVFLRNVEGRITQCNRATEEFCGTGKEAIVGAHCWEVIHQACGPISGCPVTAMIKSRQRETMTLRLKDRVFLVAVDPVINRGGELIGAVHSMEDITELKVAEETLRGQTERYRVLSQEFHALLEAIPDVITLHSPNLELVWANQRAVAKLGKEMGEVIGRPCYTLWHNRTAPCDPCPVLQTFRNGEPAIETISTPDGRVWEVRTVPVMEGERVVNVLEVGRDITEGRRMEEQLRHSQKMDTIGTLAGGIAHDFNNILTAILGYANLAYDDLPVGSQTAMDLQQVIYAGERARELVKQILTFSRQRSEETQPVQATPLVKEALKLLRASIPSTIEIRHRILAQGVIILIDPTKLHQVVMNLCTNAYQAMKATGGTLVVTLETVLFPEEGGWFGKERVSGEYLRLSVQDSGCGMDMATMERIFEPYFTTKGKEDGTGLGLSVVHGIVRGCKGYIDVQSTLGLGSLFQVIWPVYKGTPQTSEVEAVNVPGGNERILLVDDEQAVANLYERSLRTLGYQVTCRTSPLEALELFRHRSEDFDLVLTDYSMPKMDGLTFAERLRAIDPRARIILMTGFSDTHSAESLARVGIAKLLLKPVVRQDLALAIRDLLERH